MSGIKTTVNEARLGEVLKRLGREDYLAEVRKQLEKGPLTLDQRDHLIRQLVALANPSGNLRAMREKRATLREIGQCFDLSFAGMQRILSQTRPMEEKAAKGGQAKKTDHPRQPATPPAQGLLLTPARQTKIVLVLAEAARDSSCWLESQLDRERALAAMGFIMKEDHSTEDLWQTLRIGGYILEETRLGILLRYGLNIEPMEFYWEVRKDHPSLARTVGAINDGLFTAKLPTIDAGDILEFLEAKLLDAEVRAT